MAIKWVEVSVKLIDDNEPHLDVDAYTQRINYEYFQQIKSNMVAQIVAIVNDLPIPAPPQTYLHTSWPPDDV